VVDETAIEWARAEAARLRDGARSVSSTGRLAAPLEFLRVHAGPESAFFLQADRATKGPSSLSYTAIGVADALGGWVAMAESGLVDTLPWDAAVRVEASNDIMEQVQRLLDDRRVHPAAPAVLAGAALEEFLRSLIEAHSVTVRGKPSIDAYAKALKAAEVLTTQDMKDITSWGGVRNAAAHGRFDEVSVEHVRVTVAHINLFMRERRPGGAEVATAVE
jgi:hypothetical protein